ncbi:MAG: hypothetical protein AB7F86_20575, partial [Bdellovibrionales bacterium]
KRAIVQLLRELKRFVRQIRPGLIGATSNANVNLAQVIEDLKTIPDRQQELQAHLKELLTSTDFINALTQTGLTLESGVFTEVYKRIEYKFLPKVYEENDILNLLLKVFDAKATDAGWLEKVDRELLAEFLTLLLPPKDEVFKIVAPQLFMSLEILCLRLAGLGYDPIVIQRLKERREFQAAFMEVTRHVRQLLDGSSDPAEIIPLIREDLRACHQAVNWIRSRRHIDGASLALTYRLTKIQQNVGRMRKLLDVLEVMFGEWQPAPAVDLFMQITLAEIQRFNLLRFLGHNLEMLAYQITEHTGRTGEHYITRTRDEWIDMLRSAAIGGVIVAFFAMLKLFISGLGLPPVPETVAFCVIYTGTFMAIHSWGGTVATKQPAMTASTLAHALDEATSSNQAMENLTEVIVRTIRSQLVAVLGNFLLAGTAAVLICVPLVYFGKPLLDSTKAAIELKALNPIQSWTIIYSAIAGVFLWASGGMAGIADNWFIFNHVGQRLAQSDFLKRFISAEKLKNEIKTIEENIGFWVGNVSLGVLLGVIAALPAFFGLPNGNSHVAFASANLGAVLTAYKFKVSIKAVIWLFFSVVLVGLINLGVSFSLSLLVAVKSRQIRFAQTPELLRLLFKRLKTRPMDFFIPSA